MIIDILKEIDCNDPYYAKAFANDDEESLLHRARIIMEAVRRDTLKIKVEKKDGMWRNAEGIEVPVSELTDEHLANIPRFLYRRGSVIASYQLPQAIIFEIRNRGWMITEDCNILKEEETRWIKKTFFEDREDEAK